MPGFMFQGFATGSPVDITVVQDAASDNASVATWGEQVANASLNISVDLPARLTAPAGIWMAVEGHADFDVGGPVVGATYDPRYHEITHIWDTGDTGIWSAPENMPSEWNNKAVAYGSSVAHVYGSPGTYAPSVWAVDRSGNIGIDSAASLVVRDPDDVYTGTSTIVIALDGNFTGKPTGAAEVTSLAALQSAITSGAGPRRILFKRGETYTGVNLDMNSEEIEYIGAWGSGNRPILYSVQWISGNASRMFDYENSAAITQITWTDLDLRSYWRADGEVGWAAAPWWIWSVRVDNCHVTVHNCSFDGFDAIDVDLGTEQNRPGRLIMADCVVTNWRSYGVFQRRNTNADFRLAFVGCRIAQSTNARHGTNYQTNTISGNDHGPIRFEAAGQHYIGACDLYSQCGWSPLGPDQGVQPCIRINTYSDYANGFTGNIERCVMEGGFHVINMSGENGGRVEYPGNYLFDKIIMIGTAKSAQAGNSGIGIMCSFGGTTIRNAFYVMPNVAHYHDLGNPSDMVVSLFTDNPAAGNKDEKVSIHNCTAVNLRNTANDPGFAFDFVGNTAGWTALTVENNVVHAPDIDTPVNADAPIDTGALSGITPRWPGFLFGDPHITGTVGSVPQNSYFAVSYPSGKAQAYWQAFESNDTLHQLYIGGNMYYAGAGHFDVDFTQAGEIRIHNRQGTTWSGAYEFLLDDKSQTSIPNTYANPPTIPLPRPGTGSAALNSGDTGLKAYDDLLGNARPTQGNERGAVLK